MVLGREAVGSAVPAFITEPGRHQRARVTAAAVVMAGALFVTHGGATLFSLPRAGRRSSQCPGHTAAGAPGHADADAHRDGHAASTAAPIG